MAQVPSNLIPSTVTQLPFAPEASAQGLLLYTLNGVSYKIYAGDLLQVAGVPTTRQVIAGTGLQGGGQLSSNVTLSVAPGGIGTTQLASSGVTPGTYGSSTQVPVLTVDATGRVMAATSAAVTVSGYVPESRQVIAGPGLTGGGALNTNVTLGADFSSATPLALSGTGSAGVAITLSRADHRHPAVDLADQTQVDGILPLDQGGTARSLVPNAGAVVWSGGDGLYIGPAGNLGQVLVSGGTGAPTWGSALVVSPQLANTVFAGPAAGSAADPTFRALVNADVPTTLTGKTLTSATITGSTVDSTVIGGSVPAAGTFTTANATDVNATTVDTTNLEVTNLKAKDGTVAASIADSTGAVTVSTLLNVDNLRLDGNTLSSTNTNGNITLDPNGTGEVVIPAGIDSPLYIEFNTTQNPLPSDATGRLYYDYTDQFQTLAFQMNGNVVQKIGEEQFYRVKCSSAVTKGQVVMFTGTLGSSGGLTAAPATGLTKDQAQYVLGLAAESGNNNDWIFVVAFGEVKNLNTTGGAETWVQGDELYYNPAVTGGLTKIKPTVPNAIVLMAAVVNVGTSNGILFVRPTYGSVLGGTDGNVQFSTLTNGDVIVYDGPQQRWENAAQSALAVGTATNLAGGAAGSLPYQSGAGATTFLGIGSGLQVLKVNAGATAPEWVTGAALSKVDDTNVTLTLGGAPSTALLAAASLTLGWTGQLSVARGGTGASAFTANGVVYGNTASALQVTAAGTTGQMLVGNTGAAPSWSAATSVAVTSLSFGTTGLTPSTATQGAITVAGTLITTNGGTGLSSYTAGDILYASGATTLSKKAIGASGLVLVAGNAQPEWSYVMPSAGGTGITSYVSGDILFATGTSSLATRSIGSNGSLLTVLNSAPEWTSPSSVTVGTATNAVNTGITDDTSAAATVYPTWVTANTGNLPQKVSSTKLTFNPSTGVLTATGGIGGGVF
jgi:hypothetical protein